MKRVVLAAVAALALSATAFAGTDDEYACMHYGPTSPSCQYYRQQEQMENRLRALENQQRNQSAGSYRTNCALYGRC
jgi:diadenosine tetraphosphatase ApaH/serine/threonine PP2A family protein phosphatase